MIHNEGSGGDAIPSPEALTQEQSEISTDAGGNDDTVAALVGTELNLAEGMISNHVTLNLKSSFDAHCFINSGARPTQAPPPNLQENMNSVKVRMQSRRDRAKPWDVAVSQRRHGKQHIMTEDIVFIMPCPDESFRVEVCEQDSPRRQAQLLAFRLL